MKDEDKLLVFESLPIKKAVLRQAVPAVASQLIALVYSLADTWFVGLLNDPVQTAAVTVVYPSFVMLTAVSCSISTQRYSMLPITTARYNAGHLSALI